MTIVRGVLQPSRETFGGDQPLSEKKAFQRRKPALVVPPRRIVKRMRVFPLADGGDQLQPEVLPVEMSGLGKRTRTPNAWRSDGSAKQSLPSSRGGESPCPNMLVSAKCSNRVCINRAPCVSAAHDGTAGRFLTRATPIIPSGVTSLSLASSASRIPSVPTGFSGTTNHRIWALLSKS